MRERIWEAVVVIGVGIVVYATFQWTVIGGWYVLGVALIILGIAYDIGGIEQIKRGKK